MAELNRAAPDAHGLAERIRSVLSFNASPTVQVKGGFNTGKSMTEMEVVYP
jgi:hypothetical protein